jgi:hypothetical protein
VGNDNDWAVAGTHMHAAVSGNVGIGIATPAVKLDVVGDVQASGTITSGASITVDGGNHRIAGSDALEVHVGGARALRLEPHATSPNVIGGYGGNAVGPGSHGATISGGGYADYPNAVAGDYGTVGGGLGNVAGSEDGQGATVGGGWFNDAGGHVATVAGGSYNRANGQCAAVPGGSRNEAAGAYSFAAGRRAKATHDGAFVWADSTDANFASGAADEFSVRAAGGVRLHVDTDGGGLRLEPHATSPTVVAGHSDNSVTSGAFGATISGGGGAAADHNTVTDDYGSVGGGRHNQAGDNAGTTQDATLATVGGGYNNIASGQYATVPGGYQNEAVGAHSFAAGRRAKAEGQGTFVWADTVAAEFRCTGANMFVVRAVGGVWFGTTSSPSIPAGRFINTSTGGYLSTGGAWTDNCDRARKRGFEPVDRQQVLDRVAALPITTWSYRAESSHVRHIGPVAQDFHAAFGLGADDKHLSALDTSGVALAAIQGLHQVVQEKEADATARLAEKDAEVAELKARLAKLEALVERLTEQKPADAE